MLAAAAITAAGAATGAAAAGPAAAASAGIATAAGSAGAAAVSGHTSRLGASDEHAVRICAAVSGPSLAELNLSCDWTEPPLAHKSVFLCLLS